MSPDQLPQPGRTRWQPLRLGLVDLFLYDHQEFQFRDGHLLLRGNNGTGKSKVLALTLPFLLDGELSASRVEPGAESDKRMEWNLLLGGKYEQRLGYSWLEFGRRDEVGANAFVTVGCGLKAVAGRGIADRWFFVVSGRVGIDFGLVGPTGVAHTRERLVEALEGIGHVYRTAEEYRRAIDERLFHLGLERYETLVNLLIQLRQPQLSRRPDEAKLSRALTEALRPVDQAILSVVAQAFHDLEQQREELRGLRETHTAVDRFLLGYRRYAATGARRLAGDVRNAHSAFQASQRELAEVRQELERAEAEDQAAADQHGRGSRELAGARGQVAELRDSREVRELDVAERLAQMAEQRAEHAALLHAEAERDVDLRRNATEATRATIAEANRRLQLAVIDSDRAADAAGLPQPDRGLIAALSDDSAQQASEGAIRAAELAASEGVRRRTDAVRHLRGMIDLTDAVVKRLTAERTQLFELAGQRDASRERLARCLQETQDAASALIDAWREYLRSLVEVRVAASEEVLARVGGWAETVDGADPGTGAVALAAEAARNALSELRAQALATRAEHSNVLALLVQERDRLLRGETIAPPQPHTRIPETRAGRPGAPLWQLVDFRAEVSDRERAGLEAALEAAGILDAWVTPNGQLLDFDTDDVMVLARTPFDPRTSLAGVLEPAIDRDQPLAALVHPETVRAILAGIGAQADESDVWVDSSGRWRLGVLQGHWTKSAAAFIGRGARDAARRRRLNELAGEIVRAENAVQAAHIELDRIERRQRMLSDELARAPGAEPLREAHRAAQEAQRQLAAIEALVFRHETLVGELESQANAALSARDEAAVDLDLPATLDALEDVRQAVSDYRESVASLWPQARAQLERLGTLHTGLQLVARTQAVSAERTIEAEQTGRAAVEERGRLTGLRASIGATVEHIRMQLEAVNLHIAALERRLGQLEDLRRGYANRVGRAQDSQTRLETRMSEQDERRAVAIGLLRRFASRGLLTLAVPDVELAVASWAPDPAARLARRVEQALETTDADDRTWERIQREVASQFKELQDGLSLYGHYAAIDPVDGLYVVSITFNGHQRSPDELVVLLSDDIEHRDRLLSARERELLEEHLVNEVASHLQELIRDAEMQVQAMNEELRQRPTSTGMRLRCRWTVRSDGPPGLAEARTRLLRQVHDAWSIDDRAAVSAFLKRQIDAMRTANENGTWLEHLTQAFDYRHWHHFSIERLQDGQWRAASGPASSGERVLTVTLPLFAAASAHYRSAHPAAPRLVMLDEVFAGVDDDSRSKSIGLLDTFDLDFVMTSEREWGCYATLPGLAIYQLARRDGIDAVHVTAWTWDGRARRAMAEMALAVAPPAEITNGLATNGHLPGLNGV